MIVVDTMLPAYLVLRTPYSEECERLRRIEAEWVAPQFMEVELQSVLWQFIRRGTLSLDEAPVRYETAMAFVPRQIDVSAEATLRLAAKHDLSPYDARFAVLADEFGVNLVTYDKALLRKVPLAVLPADLLRLHSGST